MRADQIRALSSGELSKQLVEAQQQLVNYREINKVKKRIARMKTIIRERELAGE